MKIEPEREIELEYVIKIKTYGKRRSVRPSIGNTLAKVAWLKFGPKAEVSSGKRIYRWDPTMHAGGTPENLLIEDEGDPDENIALVVDTGTTYL